MDERVLLEVNLIYRIWEKRNALFLAEKLKKQIIGYFIVYELMVPFGTLCLKHFLLMFPRQGQEEGQQMKLILGPLSIARGQKQNNQLFNQS